MDVDLQAIAKAQALKKQLYKTRHRVVMKAILFFIRCFANSDSLHGLASAYSYGICTHSLQYIGKG
ncbi:hypothetical protein [Bartonella sp. AA83SXKL]|uniref:hypothetical protein n=1 Tax=Bartonella sp. AA83SXKL TaxID=3243439 RepID=UPI0035CF92E3